MINKFKFKGNPLDVQGRVTVVSFLEEPFSAACPRKIRLSTRGFFATVNLGYFIEKFEPSAEELIIAEEVKRLQMLSSPEPAQVIGLYRKRYDIDEKEIECFPEDMMIAGSFTNPDEAKKAITSAANTYFKMYFDQQKARNAIRFARTHDFENRSVRRYMLNTFITPYAEVCRQPVSVQTANKAIDLESGLDFFVRGSFIAGHSFGLMNQVYLSGGKLSPELTENYLDLIDSIHLMRFEESAQIRDKILKLEGKPAFQAR